MELRDSEGSLHLPQNPRVLRFTQDFVHLEAIKRVESSDNFAAGFDVGDLVFSHWYKELRAGVSIHDNVRALQHWIPQEPVVMQVLVLHVVESFLIRGNALQ